MGQWEHELEALFERLPAARVRTPEPRASHEPAQNDSVTKHQPTNQKKSKPKKNRNSSDQKKLATQQKAIAQLRAVRLEIKQIHRASGLIGASRVEYERLQELREQEVQLIRAAPPTGADAAKLMQKQRSSGEGARSRRRSGVISIKRGGLSQTRGRH